MKKLPSNMERLTTFGWRPDHSPDGKTIAFVNKEFGDVFTMDLESREMNCLTATTCPDHPEHALFIRANYLPDGNLLLVGIEKWPEPVEGQKMGIYSRARHEDCRMYYLSKEPRSIPIPFGPYFYEAAAIAELSSKVAYVENWWSDSSLPEGRSHLYVADLCIENGQPRLENPQLKMQSEFPPEGRLAAVDFYDNDKKLMVISYDWEPTCAAHVISLDLESGEATDMSRKTGVVDEPAGMFPDGEHTLMRSSRHIIPTEPNPKTLTLVEMDLYKLKLDGTGEDCRRLTWISDHKGFKANNASVAPDGKSMIVQLSQGESHGDMISAGLVKYTF